MPVAGTSTNVTDEPINIVVTPSQASYFAGETFSVTVTITNARTRESSVPLAVVRSAASHAHKRGSHSISSVPMARPPTSPVSRTASSQFPDGGKPTDLQGGGGRRGLIGNRVSRTTNGTPEGAANGKRPGLTKSLSLSIAPHEFESHLKEDSKGKLPMRAVRNQDSYNCECTLPSLRYLR